MPSQICNIPGSEITPPELFSQRRRLLLAGAASLLGTGGTAVAATGTPLAASRNPRFALADKPTPQATMTSYGNFYEFGPDKDSPAKHAHRLQLRPWTITVDGEVKQKKTFAIEDILAWGGLEERIYRFRCVEGWSAVVPWIGLPFGELLKRVEPTGNARFVEFWSLADPEQMPYVRTPFLDWPYIEALRLDEARHPLTLLALGMYGEVMSKQNGAPLRLIVPWKYGFKGAKSIVRIRLVEKQPATVWTKAAPDEYGFYSNVNPEVPHKRWSQSHERRLGEFFKRKTLPFNGYAEEVAGLYSGMDLKANF